MNLVKRCPRCRGKRPLTEMVCGGAFQDRNCKWNLFEVLPTPETLEQEPQWSEATSVQTAAPASGGLCRNGHPLEPGDFLCMVCGEATISTSTPSEPASTEGTVRTVNGWQLISPMDVVSGESDLYLATCDHSDRQRGVFKHYRRGIEPEASLYPALRKLDPDHGLRLLDSGRFESRAYEVWEYIPLGTLGAITAAEKANPEFVRQVVHELGSALQGLADVQILHRDLKPANVLVRTREPLDLVLADFSTAAVSEFDLQLTTSRQTTRYAAPETIVGTNCAASDWWSLGVMILEMLTQGRGFQGVHERAFLLNLITRGLRVPSDLPEEWQELLKGLLTRDPSRRWSWAQVRRWLNGERGIHTEYEHEETTAGGLGHSLRLGTRSWSTPESFALAAAESESWPQANSLLLTGRLATWLEERKNDCDRKRAVELRTITSSPRIPEDARLPLALLVLNENLPLCLNGELITPTWILSHPEVALAWLASDVPKRLKRLNRELWLVQLSERADRIRTRIRESQIECDEAQLSAALLATSESMLDLRWQDRRRHFPEALHPLLAATAERRAPSEEDLILLISAQINQFRPASDVLAEARKEAAQAGLEFSPQQTIPWFELGRRQILDALNTRLAHFVRCGREVPDRWADDFRQSRRIGLSRALVLLGIDKSEWRQPPRQDYVRNVLDFFYRRLLSGLQRGALGRMTIGKSSARLDLTELAGSRRTAESLLDGIILRSGQTFPLDPEPLLAEPERERRLRRLNQNAHAYSKETGIKALYVGFPFVVLRDARAGETAKPRIAPVLLWPVRLEMSQSGQGVPSLGFDRDRAEVRINPTLESMLGPTAQIWLETLEEICARDHVDMVSIVDALAQLASETHRGTATARVVPLPPQTVRVMRNGIKLYSSAVLFLCDFSGQTIAEDLKHLSSRPIQGTALEVAIRAGTNPVADVFEEAPREVDRYFTSAADPSQQSAVFRSRRGQGLVVQGPPGTGKSQTIVNIVCDAIGRGERVLIVCQKLAALNVVRKRLDTEGLANRLFVLNDPVADRKPALLELRSQLESSRRDKSHHRRLLREREGLALQIESLERDLNEAHQALERDSPNHPCRPPYREIVDELIGLESTGIPPECPEIRAQFSKLDKPAVEQLVGEIRPIASLWLESQFEGSALACLADFYTDDAVCAQFSAGLDNLIASESRRIELIRAETEFFDLTEPAPLKEWLAQHESYVRTLPDEVASSLTRWHELLRPLASDQTSAIGGLIPWLEQSLERLEALDRWTLDTRLFEKMATWGTGPLRELVKAAGELAVEPKSLLKRWSPQRWTKRRQLHAWIRSAGAEPQSIDLPTLQAATELELSFRDEKAALKQWKAALGEQMTPTPETLPAIRAEIWRLVELLKPALETARRINLCPLPEAITKLYQGDTEINRHRILNTCNSTLRLHSAITESDSILSASARWFDARWVEGVRQAFKLKQTTTDELHRLRSSANTIPAYQEFRRRSTTLNPAALALLSVLRTKESSWRGLEGHRLPNELSRTILREALLEWKGSTEAESPALLMSLKEHAEKVKLLAAADEKMREANRKVLAQCPPDAKIAERGEWDGAVMLTGPRARRLREVVEHCEPLGLFALRPVWMMNPEMASRLFTLQPGMFDLLVFDEASQLPVECALPALYRARRFVVSGDEKQMPPARFFSAQFESDEDAESETLMCADDEGLGDEEREQIRQAAERRELKDCPDLLSLAQNILPTATLEIHYRSRYRELINFSNSAFYSGRLSVPARHPEHVIRQKRPLEVDRVDGCYTNQTNPDEASRVVARLRRIWLETDGGRPSVGVVTFNLKQAELIQDALIAEAKKDVMFALAWETEQNRSQGGEDMGFFVKNLENVQGDERDVIIFSTTFGRDSAGVFRRNFGVLGQHGGERRLNVAITRARLKTIVVTSMPLNEISSWTTSQLRRPPSIPRDFLQGWLAYAERVDTGQFQNSQNLLCGLSSGSQSSFRGRGSKAASIFKDEVAEFLRGLGHAPIQADGDAFGVDFALVEPKNGLFGLAVECGAPCHEVLATARAREIWRPSVLNTSIPVIHRVDLREWYHNKATEKRRLSQAVLLALGN
jgi:primosomal replication protein N''